MNLTWIQKHSTIVNLLAMAGQTILGCLVYFQQIGLDATTATAIAVFCNIAVVLAQRTKQLPSK